MIIIIFCNIFSIKCLKKKKNNGVSGNNVKVENSYKQNKITPFWPMQFFSDEPGKKIIDDIVSRP